MEFNSSKLSGCYFIRPQVFKDTRGAFFRTWSEPLCKAKGLPIPRLAEQYYTLSKKGVIRGMHFQIPPSAQDKIVTIMSGTVLDVVLDLRQDSKTFGEYDSFEMNADIGASIFIPKGLAHGFQALTDNVIMAYQVSEAYMPAHEVGLRFDTFGFDWPIKDWIVSEKDVKATLPFDEFKSPF